MFDVFLVCANIHFSLNLVLFKFLQLYITHVFISNALWSYVYLKPSSCGFLSKNYVQHCFLKECAVIENIDLVNATQIIANFCVRG